MRDPAIVDVVTEQDKMVAARLCAMSMDGWNALNRTLRAPDDDFNRYRKVLAVVMSQPVDIAEEARS